MKKNILLISIILLCGSLPSEAGRLLDAQRRVRAEHAEPGTSSLFTGVVVGDESTPEPVDETWAELPNTTPLLNAQRRAIAEHAEVWHEQYEVPPSMPMFPASAPGYQYAVSRGAHLPSRLTWAQSTFYAPQPMVFPEPAPAPVWIPEPTPIPTPVPEVKVIERIIIREVLAPTPTPTPEATPEPTPDLAEQQRREQEQYLAELDEDTRQARRAALNWLMLTISFFSTSSGVCLLYLVKHKREDES